MTYANLGKNCQGVKLENYLRKAVITINQKRWVVTKRRCIALKKDQTSESHQKLLETMKNNQR